MLPARSLWLGGEKRDKRACAAGVRAKKQTKRKRQTRERRGRSRRCALPKSSVLFREREMSRLKSSLPKIWSVRSNA